MKDGESSMEQTEILLTIQRQLTMLQSTIDSLKEQSRQKDEEIERLWQIILNLQRTQFGQRSDKRTYVLDGRHQQLSLFDTQGESMLLVTAGRKSVRWKSFVCRCLRKRESWICQTMRR